VLAAVARPEQQLRNALYSGTRGAKAVSGRRPDRGGLLAYRLVLLHAESAYAEIPGSHNDDKSRSCD
jgi:hypothetical protein